MSIGAWRRTIFSERGVKDDEHDLRKGTGVGEHAAVSGVCFVLQFRHGGGKIIKLWCASVCVFFCV